jgi:nicotinate phosphoribosyltransferase
MLDEAGFQNASILASNDLDEHVIQSLKLQGARVNVWGVGTKLVTAYDQPALGGVYKLSAVRDAGTDPWQYKLKLSEQAAKVSTPGVLQVRRFLDADRGCLLADAVFNEAAGPFPMCTQTAIVDVNDPTLRTPPPAGMNVRHEELLVPVFRGGSRVYDPPSLSAVRDRTTAQLAALPAGTKRFLNPHRYPHGLERSLHELKTKLILDARGEGVAT